MPIKNKRNKLNKLNDADNKKFLDELCTWIDEHLDTTLGLKEILSKTNLSSTDLQYLFEKYRQTTPMTYIRHKRDIVYKVAKPTNFIFPRFLSIS